MILGDKVEGGAQQINTGSCQVRFVSSYYRQVFAHLKESKQEALRSDAEGTNFCRDSGGGLTHLIRETVKLLLEGWFTVVKDTDVSAIRI